MCGVGFRGALVPHVFKEKPYEPIAILSIAVVAWDRDGHVREDLLVDRALDCRTGGRATLRDDGLAVRPDARQPIRRRFIPAAQYLDHFRSGRLPPQGAPSLGGRVPPEIAPQDRPTGHGAARRRRRGGDGPVHGVGHASGVAAARRRPRSSCKRASHPASARSRCVMRNAVRPSIKRSIASRMADSVFASTELVGSSKIKRAASLRKARARATRCRSPPESCRPRSPTGVSYPRGKRTMKSWAPAAAAARAISAALAPGRP